MIHRLALLLGGAAAAGVVTFALVLGGSGSPPPSPAAPAADAFVPVANDLSTPRATDTPKKDVQTVYVRPTHSPAVHHGGTTPNSPQPTAKPHHPRTDNGGSQGGAGNGGGAANGGGQGGDDGYHGGSHGGGERGGD